jgi:hypothetical protein
VPRSVRAGERFGLNGDDMATLRGTLGPAKLIGWLDKIGRAMGEDTLAGAGRKDMGLTPATAETRRAEIMRDKEFQARLQSKDKSALAEWNAINATLAAAEEAQQRAA